MTTATIDPSYRSLIEDKIAKLNRRAVKLGLAPMSVTFTERVSQRALKGGGFREVIVLDVEIEGQAPRLGDWDLVCRIEHTPAGNLVTGPIGVKSDLSAWYDAAPVCEHCHTSRDRRDTFILRRADGSTIQVGRSCLADFVRSTDAVKVAMAALWGDFFPSDEESCGFGGSWTFPTLTVVAHAVAAIRVVGAYVPSSAERGTTRGTVDFSLSPCRDKSVKDAWLSLQPTATDRAQAELVIAWAREQSGSDYAHNLAVACSSLAEPERARGLLVSAPTAYTRALARAATRANRDAQPKVTPVAGRYAVTGRVATKRIRESDHGDMLKMLIAVETPEGLWNGWCTVPAGLTVTEGDAVTITATVKPKEPGFAIMSRPKVAPKAAAQHAPS